MFSIKIIIGLAICLSVFSLSRMHLYLYRIAKAKYKNIIFNPAFPLDYLELTKEKTGRIGIWFKLGFISITIAFLLGGIMIIMSILADK